jgi:hypothetical protein
MAYARASEEGRDTTARLLSGGEWPSSGAGEECTGMTARSARARRRGQSVAVVVKLLSLLGVGLERCVEAVPVQD